MFGRCDSKPLAGKPPRLQRGAIGRFVIVGPRQRLQLSLLQPLCLRHRFLPRRLRARKRFPYTLPAVVVRHGVKQFATGLAGADFCRGAARFHRDDFVRHERRFVVFFSSQSGRFAEISDSQ